ncbi:protein of unknown function [Shewanella benthica]|uniref:Uncharacterized protein n=1 Tax=Shewanella benthica TaxID=43661 RepID=A0A330M0J9_9GAMM|nr:hypothetical protein [Shewanella benthica]SQH75651.1 protein of unknown function [Shewanella benthica]
MKEKTYNQLYKMFISKGDNPTNINLHLLHLLYYSSNNPDERNEFNIKFNSTTNSLLEALFDGDLKADIITSIDKGKFATVPSKIGSIEYGDIKHGVFLSGKKIMWDNGSGFEYHVIVEQR